MAKEDWPGRKWRRGRNPGSVISGLLTQLVNISSDDMYILRGKVLCLLIFDDLTWVEASGLTLDDLHLELGLVMVDDQSPKPISKNTREAIQDYLVIRHQRGQCNALLTTAWGNPMKMHDDNISWYIRVFGRQANIHQNLSITTLRKTRDYLKDCD